jgi:DNA-binding NarL/FixJ family response regulator
MNLLIVDDHEGMRRMIRQLVSGPGDVVHECASADEALQAFERFKPDCVTLDISMPGLCALRVAHPPARVVFVSSHDQPDFRRAAREAGAAGFVTKDNLSELYFIVAAKRLAQSLKVLVAPPPTCLRAFPFRIAARPPRGGTDGMKKFQWFLVAPVMAFLGFMRSG